MYNTHKSLLIFRKRGSHLYKEIGSHTLVLYFIITFCMLHNINCVLLYILLRKEFLIMFCCSTNMLTLLKDSSSICFNTLSSSSFTFLMTVGCYIRKTFWAQFPTTNNLLLVHLLSSFNVFLFLEVYHTREHIANVRFVMKV